MSDYSALHLNPGEQVILEVRKHWIVFVGRIISFVIFSLAPLVVLIVLENYVPKVSASLLGPYFSFLLFFYILWILFLWIGFFLSWTKYFLDVWYVTPERIIDIEQQRIFYREVSNLRFDRIQDITVEVNGFLATFLNFGDIRVQTASENENDFFMSTVKDPDNVKRIIFAQHNIVGDQTKPAQQI